MFPTIRHLITLSAAAAAIAAAIGTAAAGDKLDVKNDSAGPLTVNVLGPGKGELSRARIDKGASATLTGTAITYVQGFRLGEKEPCFVKKDPGAAITIDKDHGCGPAKAVAAPPGGGGGGLVSVKTMINNHSDVPVTVKGKDAAGTVFTQNVEKNASAGPLSTMVDPTKPSAGEWTAANAGKVCAQGTIIVADKAGTINVTKCGTQPAEPATQQKTFDPRLGGSSLGCSMKDITSTCPSKDVQMLTQLKTEADEAEKQLDKARRDIANLDKKDSNYQQKLDAAAKAYSDALDTIRHAENILGKDPPKSAIDYKTDLKKKDDDLGDLLNKKATEILGCVPKITKTSVGCERKF